MIANVGEDMFLAHIVDRVPKAASLVSARQTNVTAVTSTSNTADALMAVMA